MKQMNEIDHLIMEQLEKLEAKHRQEIADLRQLLGELEREWAASSQQQAARLSELCELLNNCTRVCIELEKRLTG